MKKRRKIKISQLLGLLAVFTLIFALFYGYFFILNRSPLIIERFISVGGKNSPPDFLGNIIGSTEGKLDGPLAVAADHEGNIFVADTNNSLIQVFNQSGQYIGQFGVGKDGSSLLDYPNAIVVGKDKNVYIGEFRRNRIQVFTRQGEYVKTIDNRSVHRLVSPLALATDESGNLYVANRNGEILVLNKAGELINSIGKPGSDQGSLSYPNGLAVDDRGNIFVSDSGNKRIQVFNRQGTLVTVFAAPQFSAAYARGIALDDKDRLHVVDTFRHKVLVYDTNMKFLYEFGGRGLDEGKFNFPNGIAISGKRVIVTDRENDRVVVFIY